MRKKLSYAIFTDNGDRDINEDCIGVCQQIDKNFFVLCDGLGGHGMGDVASSLAVGVFDDMFDKTSSPSSFLEQSFLATQDLLMTEQKARGAKNKMKTTAVALATDEKNAYIGYIGDSRVYVFKRNKVKMRTQDHSIPQMLALSGEIKESEIRKHPERNMLLRVLGVEWDSPLFELLKPLPLRKCQAFLLCSDGFWELIEESAMCDLLKKSDTVEEWLSSMLDVVKTNGIGHNMDNYSAIAIWCE